MDTYTPGDRVRYDALDFPGSDFHGHIATVVDRTEFLTERVGRHDRGNKVFIRFDTAIQDFCYWVTHPRHLVRIQEQKPTVWPFEPPDIPYYGYRD